MEWENFPPKSFCNRGEWGSTKEDDVVPGHGLDLVSMKTTSGQAIKNEKFGVFSLFIFFKCAIKIQLKGGNVNN